jgi:hypothetical protein
MSYFLEADESKLLLLHNHSERPCVAKVYVNGSLSTVHVLEADSSQTLERRGSVMEVHFIPEARPGWFLYQPPPTPLDLDYSKVKRFTLFF